MKKKTKKVLKFRLPKQLKLTSKDEPEIEKIKRKIIDTLEQLGGYLPIDEIYVVEGAKAIVLLRKLKKIITQKIDKALEGDKKEVKSLPGFIDALSKLQSIAFDWLSDGLAVNRKERLNQKQTAEVKTEIKRLVQRLMGIEK